MRSVLLLSAALAVMGALPDESSLQVVAPAPLFDAYQQGIHHSEALFGIPKYGRGLTANAHAVLETGTTTTLSNGCDAFDPLPQWGDKPILLMRRESSKCSFTTKVANAQAAGAAAALIVNSAPVCGLDATLCPRDGAACQSCYNNRVVGPNPNSCECILPLMQDDGAHSVDIPSFLIPQTAGEAIVACLAGTAPCPAGTADVVLRMEWSLPAPDDRVEWSIWSTAIDTDAETFREQFISLVPLLGQSVLFTPEYFIYDGEAWGCTNGAPATLPCGSQCIDDGRYCSPDPDHVLNDGVSGADVVMENLRQICIFKQANETVLTDNAIRYWQYTRLFNKNCAYPNWNEQCSRAQVEAAQLSWTGPSGVEACIAASGNASYPNGGPNTVLEQQMRDRANLFIVNLPTVVINNVIERGTISPSSVLRTICSGFQLQKPDVCECANVDSHWLSVCAEQGLSAVPPQFGGTKGVADGAGLPGWATFVIVLLVLVVIGLAVGGFIAYRRTHTNLRNMLEDYRRLEGDDDNAALTQL